MCVCVCVSVYGVFVPVFSIECMRFLGRVCTFWVSVCMCVYVCECIDVSLSVCLSVSVSLYV